MKFLYILWIIILFAGIYGIWQVVSKPVIKQIAVPVYPTVTLVPSGNVSQEVKSLFVPYWSLTDSDNIDSTYSSVLYFGIEAASTGIIKNEPGYQNLAQFVQFEQPGTKKLLVVRMLDNQQNSLILQDISEQTQIIQQTVTLAQKYNFNGVVVDLELSALPFDSVVQQINAFHDRFATAVKAQHLSYGLTIYGDVFYRARPFDVAHLAKTADQIYIMAYDLHKANGDPGPNFPIHDDDYDLDKMTNSFLSVTVPDKLTVVWGLFGYDWEVDAHNNAVGTAKSLSYLQIKQKFLDGCTLTDCSVQGDSASGETIVHYVDSNGEKHIVWFDDPSSALTKEKFLLSKGINHFSYWAWSYF